jgi:hypothetical protein
MKLKMVVAAAVVGLFLAGVCVGRAYGGWFGFGDSSKSASAGKTASDVYDPNKIASGPKTGSSKGSGGIAGVFGLGKPSSSAQSSKKAPLASASKSQKSGKSEGTSWWNSLFKPKEPGSKLKTTTDWMKLKQVRY